MAARNFALGFNLLLCSFCQNSKVKHTTHNLWTLSQPWKHADRCMSRGDPTKVSMNMVYILNAFKITVDVASEAGGRAGFHRPSPELCRGVCLPSTPPRWQHGPVLSLLTARLSLNHGPCGAFCSHPGCKICHHFSHPSPLSLLPISFPFLPYSSAFPQRALASAESLPAIEVALLDQQACPSTSLWMQPQGHWPLLAVFIPNFSVDGLSTWHKCFPQPPLFGDLEFLWAWSFPLLWGRSRFYLRKNSDQPVLWKNVGCWYPTR